MGLLDHDPKTLGLAILFGIIPSLIWLWFWLKEGKKSGEPTGILTVCFIAGMFAVILVLPIQRFLQSVLPTHNMEVIAWASAEEILKYLAVLLLLYKTSYVEDPLDWPIYLITAALGFAALENALFLLKPLSLDQTTVGLLTGHLRFLGSTLLHTVSSGAIGIALGLSIHLDKKRKRQYLLVGLFAAITLHSAFNFFIIKNNGNDFLKVFGFLWVVTIIMMLLFEKLRRANTN